MSNPCLGRLCSGSARAAGMTLQCAACYADAEEYSGYQFRSSSPDQQPINSIQKSSDSLRSLMYLPSDVMP